MARLQGTFLQFTAAHGDWQPADWAKLFGYFKELRLTQLVIQWTVYDDLAFFPAPEYQQVAQPPLSTIMQLADAAGLKSGWAWPMTRDFGKRFAGTRS